MNYYDPLEELLVCRLDSGQRTIQPCSIVIFGASGDLTYRKLIPALYHLFVEDLLPKPFQIIGFARREKSNEGFRNELLGAFRKYARTRLEEPKLWAEFARHLTYHQGDFSRSEDFQGLKERLAAQNDEKLRQNLLFYLAISPTLFGEVASQLTQAGLLNKGEESGGWQRLVVEKPFGQNLESAQQLNSQLGQCARERQLFRIDHYLGKETVQNIMIFRFSNSIFERLWNRDVIDHVQITVSEKLGVGSRGGYYEESGALRDMVQNHLLQVLALIGMEPPGSLESEAIRDEKVKLLQSIRPIEPHQVSQRVVRGQYLAGEIDGDRRPAYREVPRVDAQSNVETYTALLLHIDNWRWSGVPFYLRTGKCLGLNASEVRIQFKSTPQVLFAAQCGSNLDVNSLTLRLQPNEGISLRFNGKIPGASTQLRPVRMHFSYDSEFGAYTPEAYERLLIEAIAGNATLFIRSDELETAWQIIDSIRTGWGDTPLNEKEFYPAGSWGPIAADELLALRGHTWRQPDPH